MRKQCHAAKPTQYEIKLQSVELSHIRARPTIPSSQFRRNKSIYAHCMPTACSCCIASSKADSKLIARNPVSLDFGAKSAVLVHSSISLSATVASSAHALKVLSCPSSISLFPLSSSATSSLPSSQFSIECDDSTELRFSEV
mmetsp:Transcript_16216/g.31396  ORF Transcript_16216/g.31396 Transcript_16216/m.31396 type:complete len:142 (+) Transcript_16216:398-823(+)